MDDRNAPIGIFDSGIGGLTVANAVVRHLPNERIIYFGDTAHLPYGDKSADAIRYYSLRIAKLLLEKGCKMIVVACNSASSAAYHVLLDFFKGQALFVNVVDPLVNAVVKDDLKKIGVIATKATIDSGIYQKKLRESKQHLEVYAKPTPLLVPMIEEGYSDNTISKTIIREYISDPGFSDMQGLLLACTHYPLIKDQIKHEVGNKVRVLDSTDVVTKEIDNLLESQNLSSEKKHGEHLFLVSDYTRNFEETTKLFYGEEIHLEHAPFWD